MIYDGLQKKTVHYAFKLNVPDWSSPQDHLSRLCFSYTLKYSLNSEIFFKFKCSQCG